MNYYGRDKDIQLKVGLMVLLTVIILLFGYSWLRDWFSRGTYQEVHVMFENAGNIDEGDQVTVFGVKSGRVDDIKMTREGVIVTLLIDIDFKLPIDSKFLISDTNLMGSRQVEIIPGSDSEYIHEGYVAKGESLSSLSSLVPKIDEMVSEINNFVQLFSYENDDLPQMFMETLNTVHSISVKLDTLLEDRYDDLSDTIISLQRTTKQVDDIISANKDSIAHTIENATDAMTQLNKSLAQLESMLITVQPLIESAAKEEGTVHRLLTEEELYHKIIDVTTRTDSLLKDIRDNPGRYFRLRLF